MQGICEQNVKTPRKDLTNMESVVYLWHQKGENSTMKATVLALALRAVILTTDVRLGDSVVCRA